MKVRRGGKEKKQRYTVTAFHIDNRIESNGSWKLKFDATKKEAENEIRIAQGQNAKWPDETVWKVRKS